MELKTLLEIENDIIYDIEFDDANVIALTSNFVYNANIKSNVQRKLDITEKSISNIAIDKAGISYTYKELSGNKNIIEFLNNRYKIIGTNEVEENVKEYIYYNSLAYVLHNKEIDIYNRWGMHIKKYQSDTVITKPIIFNGGRNIALVYSNKIVIVGI